MNGCGRKVRGAVESHQQLIAKRPEMCQHTMLFQTRKNLHKHRIEGARGNGIEERAHLIITGYHPDQAMTCDWPGQRLIGVMAA